MNGRCTLTHTLKNYPTWVVFFIKVDKVNKYAIMYMYNKYTIYIVALQVMLEIVLKFGFY